MTTQFHIGTKVSHRNLIKNKKNRYTLFYSSKVGYEGVYITWRCTDDNTVLEQQLYTGKFKIADSFHYRNTYSGVNSSLFSYSLRPINL